MIATCEISMIQYYDDVENEKTYYVMPAIRYSLIQTEDLREF